MGGISLGTGASTTMGPHSRRPAASAPHPVAAIVPAAAALAWAGHTAWVASMDITRRRELASRLLEGYVHGPAAATEATARALAKVAAAEAVVLVEGISDQIAVETLAVRRG